MGQKDGAQIIIKNFQKKFVVNPKKIEHAILKVLSKEGIKKSVQITVCLVNDIKIKELNLKYLHRNEPTDVLTFDLRRVKDSGDIFADIIVSTDTASRNSKIFKTPVSYELYLYIVHGMLHLLGYDDHTRKQRQLMRRKEGEYVNT